MAKIITEKFAFTQYTDGIFFNGKAVATAFDVPSYSVQISSPISNFVAEGSTGTYSVTTENVSDGTTLFFTILNITTNSADFSSTSGSFTITSNTGTFNIGIVADNLTEGTESYTVQVRTESTSGPIVASMTTSINDTSLSAVFQAIGSTSGYTSGGYGNPPAGNRNIIDKFPFASNANATDVGDLTIARSGPTGQSSEVSGYTSGGNGGATVIDKFPFSSGGNATDVGDLLSAVASAAGHMSSTSGYTAQAGGTGAINKFPFSNDSNATNVGVLSQVRGSLRGQSSSSHGYSSGGSVGGSAVNTIDKFPFTTDTNATDVGDLALIRESAAGTNSEISGYTSGGRRYTTANVFYSTIDKFPFATDANATNVGSLTITGAYQAGQSSTNNGYTSGGFPSTNIISKFPFASDANATNVGSLTQARYFPAGQQV